MFLDRLNGLDKRRKVLLANEKEDLGVRIEIMMTKNVADSLGSLPVNIWMATEKLSTCY